MATCIHAAFTRLLQYHERWTKRSKHCTYTTEQALQTTKKNIRKKNPGIPYGRGVLGRKHCDIPFLHLAEVLCLLGTYAFHHYCWSEKVRVNLYLFEVA